MYFVTSQRNWTWTIQLCWQGSQFTSNCSAFFFFVQWTLHKWYISTTFWVKTNQDWKGFLTFSDPSLQLMISFAICNFFFYLEHNQNWRLCPNVGLIPPPCFFLFFFIGLCTGLQLPLNQVQPSPNGLSKFRAAGDENYEKKKI